MLTGTQPFNSPFVAGVAGQMKTANPFHGDDAASVQQRDGGLKRVLFLACIGYR